MLRWLAAAPLLIEVGRAAPASAGTTTDAVKAARIREGLIHHFCQLVRWPVAGPPERLRLAVLGSDMPSTRQLLPLLRARAEQEKVERRTLIIDPVNTQQRPGDIRARVVGAHLVYVADEVEDRMTSVLVAARRRPVLLVGEGHDFAATMGHIAFVPRDGKIRLEIHRRRLQASGLKASAQLLQHAVIVGGP